MPVPLMPVLLLKGPMVWLWVLRSKVPPILAEAMVRGVPDGSDPLAPNRKVPAAIVVVPL